MYWAGRAWTYNGLKDYHNAISDANEAIRLKNEFALPHHERGVAFIEVEDGGIGAHERMPHRRVHGALRGREEARTDLIARPAEVVDGDCALDAPLERVRQ